MREQQAMKLYFTISLHFIRWSKIIINITAVLCWLKADKFQSAYQFWISILIVIFCYPA